MSDLNKHDKRTLLLRSFKQELKSHHPDHGGDINTYTTLVERYKDAQSQPQTKIKTNLALDLCDLLHGCNANVILDTSDNLLINIVIPPLTYPGSTIKVKLNDLTPVLLYVNVKEKKSTEYRLHNADILIEKTIVLDSSSPYTLLSVQNFDHQIHNIEIPSNIAASCLIYTFSGQGFFDKVLHNRGDLQVAIKIKGNHNGTRR